MVSWGAALTKTYCVPGLRLGVLVAVERLVTRIGGLRDPWSVNGIAVEAASVLAAEDDYLQRSRAVLGPERARMFEALARLGLRPAEGDAVLGALAAVLGTAC